ncbi:MAG TPA: hypothetical protein VMF08_12165 [Candidatus Sulfotelmatobacter sp.]|nr:hypothetical protein [Candidatus Sulfotelmatobacter sp.]
MPIELQIIRASDFVRLGPQGHFDLEESKLALANLARACQKRRIFQALLDLRAFTPPPVPIFSPADLASLVYTFHEMGFSKEHRLAVLYTVDPHHRARLFALIGRMRGWNVAAFDDFEDALVWLSGGKTDEPDVMAAMMQPVPINMQERPLRARKGSNAK